MTRLLNGPRHDRARLAKYVFSRPRLEGLEDRTLLATSLFDAVSGIVNSTEHLQRLVSENYQNILDRAPSTSEVQSWVNLLQSGTSIERMDALFAASPENLAQHGGLTGNWVDSLYQDFLGRSASDAEEKPG